MSLQDVLVIDLELDQSGKKLYDIGALLGSREFHGRKLDGLKELIARSGYVAGHNILRHDAPALRKRLGPELFNGKPIVDTLCWSALLYADKPYHKLVKGYKLDNEDGENNPLSDAKLCFALLEQLVGRFNNLPNGLRSIYHGLLGEQEGYAGLFPLSGFAPTPVEVDQLVREHFKGSVCSSAPLSEFASGHPVELAHALALVATTEEASILPGWVVHSLPYTQQVLHAIRFRHCKDPACAYCTLWMDPHRCLKSHFGYDSFRKFDGETDIGIQEKAVRSALAGESVLTVFPTGGGKSLTFQLPALMEGELTRSLTVVISPLVSLMKDQVEVLEHRHQIVNAAHLSGLLSPLERQAVLRQVEEGGIHLLYIAPETLRSPTLSRLLRKRQIARFVVDEAHCFSSWGHDFRVDYLYIAPFLRQLQEDLGREIPIPVSCFTATAKPQVVADIRSYFKENLGLDLVPYISQARRENLEYEVVPVEDASGAARQRVLLGLLNTCEKPAIVYASRTKRVDELVELIRATGMSVRGFHSKMDRDLKQINQDDFMEGAVEVMVATSAFGMGVDKEDVHTVIHYNISNSLESYVQEAGRAGRNKDIAAKCYILYNENDLGGHFQLLQQSKLNQKEIQQIWRAVKGLTKFRDKISRSALELAKTAGWDEEVRDVQNRVAASLAALEDRGYLKRTLNAPQVFATGLKVKDLDSALRLVRGNDGLTEQQQVNCSRVLQRLIKPDEDGAAITRVDEVADHLGLKVREVIGTVQLLRNIGVLNDEQDLSAYLDARPRAGSRIRLHRILETEKALIALLNDQVMTVSLRALNQGVQDSGVDGKVEDLKQLLPIWKKRRLVSTKRVDRQAENYQITLLKDQDELKQHVHERQAVALACFEHLENLLPDTSSVPDETKQELRVKFSLLSLKASMAAGMFGKDHELDIIAEALLFLHETNVLSLQDGFMVMYQRMNVERTEQNVRKQYTQEDYGTLRHHYQNRVEQIHMVGEYAARRMESVQAALAFVDDYFRIEHDAFVDKYFPKRRTDITRPLTRKRFIELFGDLDSEQLKVVKDSNDHILVAAGPGSGKTRVLVHKVASLLLLEDVKPEQFLMLTFSRAAAMEFRERIHAMVPEYRGLIRVTTFHGLCFELMGQLGDLDRSETVISRTMAAIRAGDVDVTGIANKSVIVLDEFQDVDQEQWQLIQLLAETAEKPRIIAVGDDDQNIYEWRGASPEFMSAFRSKFKANTHSLLINYRSKETIVRLTNFLVGQIKNRIKAGEVLLAKDVREGVQRVVRYSGGYHLAGLVQDVARSALPGTTCVLTRTNNEAIMATAMLEQRGIKARYIGGSDDFPVGRLREIRYFSQTVSEHHPGIGLIPSDVWDATVKDYLESLEGNPLQADLKDLLALFKKGNKGRHDLAEWEAFVREIRISDAVKPQKGVVHVSTMHKSKGKEFSNVFIYLSHYPMVEDKDFRLLYVACTRAMENLVIHSNEPFAISYGDATLVQETNDVNYPQPQELDHVLGMKEVNLGSCSYNSDLISTLATGSRLIPGSKQFANGSALGLDSSSGNVLLYARKFLENALPNFEREGYHVTKAKVEYIVHWYDKEKKKSYEVVLPRLRLFKQKPQE